MLCSIETMKIIASEIRESGKKLVFTNGCFDILHAGHTRYLAQAAKLGDYMVAGLNSDDSVRRLKGSTRPVNSEADRAEVLSALKSIDFVCIFNEDTPLNLIEALVPHFLVKGGDYTEETIAGAEFVKANGGSVVTIPLVEGKSTSSIINKIGK